MHEIRKTALVAVMAAMSAVAVAQSGTNSPYSQYGFGELTDASTSYSRGMGGLGVGVREHNQLNAVNPASYSAIDSLTFLFDVGITGQITNFKEGGKRLNANNADLDYVAGLFRVARHVGMSFGILPFTNVGYNYSATGRVGGDISSNTTYTNTYSGSGGLHQIYLGMGWEPLKGLSIGANASYLWGAIDRTVTNSYSDAYANTLSKYYSADVRNYKLDFGLQYDLKLSKYEKVTIGATYSLGHKLNSDPECKVISRNSQTSVSDTTVYTIDNGLEIPSAFAVGLMWNHKNKWCVGVDYTLQKWGEVAFPMYDVVGDTPQYSLKGDVFKDRHRVNVGGEYVANEDGRKFLSRIRYRFGVSYSTPYLRINGKDGPAEYGVSAGVCLPIFNYSRPSFLSISGQWMRRDAKDLICENTFRINVGLTFNERWFAKWKVK